MIGILAALRHAAMTGEGQHVDARPIHWIDHLALPCFRAASLASLVCEDIGMLDVSTARVSILLPDDVQGR